MLEKVSDHQSHYDSSFGDHEANIMVIHPVVVKFQSGDVIPIHRPFQKITAISEFGFVVGFMSLSS